jgi:hypothetical protein
MSSEISPHLWLPKPKLAFHPDRTSDTEVHPLRGLLRFGPHSAGLVPDPIRVFTLAPAGESNRLYDFMKQLNSVHKPTERKDYLPEWPGFHIAFRLSMRGAGRGCHVELAPQVENDLCTSSMPHVRWRNNWCEQFRASRLAVAILTSCSSTSPAVGTRLRWRDSR